MPDAGVALRALGMILGVVSASAAAGDPPDALKRCAGIDDREARLVCYDRLAGRAEPPPEARFGKPAPQEPAPEPKAIRTALVGTFEGWEPGTKFRLQNGQVWEASGGDRGYYSGIPKDPPVTITRGLLGAYWMQVEGVGRRIKVRRLR